MNFCGVNSTYIQTSSSVAALPTEHCQTDDQPAATHYDFTHSGKFLDMDAKQRLEKVDEQLTCAVCLRHYHDPRMLDCRHSFCRECLVDMVMKGRGGKKVDRQ